MKDIDYNKLRASFVEKGETITKLADVLGISRTAMYFKIGGRTKWSRDDIIKIADYIGREKVIEIFFAD